MQVGKGVGTGSALVPVAGLRPAGMLPLCVGGGSQGNDCFIISFSPATILPCQLWQGGSSIPAG